MILDSLHCLQPFKNFLNPAQYAHQCQLQNQGNYLDHAARSNGENSEPYWFRLHKLAYSAEHTGAAYFLELLTSAIITTENSTAVHATPELFARMLDKADQVMVNSLKELDSALLSIAHWRGGAGHATFAEIRAWKAPLVAGHETEKIEDLSALAELCGLEQDREVQTDLIRALDAAVAVGVKSALAERKRALKRQHTITWKISRLNKRGVLIADVDAAAQYEWRRHRHATVNLSLDRENGLAPYFANLIRAGQRPVANPCSREEGDIQPYQVR